MSHRKLLALGVLLAGALFLLRFLRPGFVDSAAPQVDLAQQCAESLAAQAEYLEREPHVRDHFFARYPARPSPGLRLAPLDLNSTPLAREFQTRLRQELKSRGVNFAGHYSLVGVGMTGWGMNYWIVDRRSGRAWEFPFHATFLDFDPGSSLIIMNSRDSIRSLLNQQKDGGCFYLNQEQVTDLRPFYFEWKNDTLTKLAPRDLTPPVNAFWLDYLSGIPDSTSRPIAFFVRETRKGIIGTLNRVPHEGYNGFMLIQAFPGLEPADFTGVSTLNGDYGVYEGRLQFTGNASLDAPAMTLEGMVLLLRNVATRLSLSYSTEAEVAKLVEVISSP